MFFFSIILHFLFVLWEFKNNSLSIIAEELAHKRNAALDNNFLGFTEIDLTSIYKEKPTSREALTSRAGKIDLQGGKTPLHQIIILKCIYWCMLNNSISK